MFRCHSQEEEQVPGAPHPWMSGQSSAGAGWTMSTYTLEAPAEKFRPLDLFSPLQKHNHRNQQHWFFTKTLDFIPVQLLLVPLCHMLLEQITK